MPRATVRVDPRIELLATVQLLSGYERTGLITRYEVAYLEEMRQHFAPFKEHAAVQYYAEMSRNGFAGSAPVEAVLHYSGVPTLEPVDSLIGWKGGIRNNPGGNKFVSSMRKFARESKFMNFFDAHREFYRGLEKRVVEIVGDGLEMSALENYYGFGQRSYTIILAPIFHHGGYGPRLVYEDGTADVFSVVGPTAAQNGTPDFGDLEVFENLCDHEFSHSFINPLVDQHSRVVDSCQILFKSMRGRMSAQGYASWRICVYEHLVRAITIRLAYQRSADEGESALAEERERGFVYVAELCEMLEVYESDRDNYPTLKEFFPDLLSVFEDALDRR